MAISLKLHFDICTSTDPTVGTDWVSTLDSRWRCCHGSGTHHGGVEPAHRRKISCFACIDAVRHQVFWAGGALDVRQAFAPGRGRHQPQDGEGGRDHQVLREDTTRHHTCPLLTCAGLGPPSGRAQQEDSDLHGPAHPLQACYLLLLTTVRKDSWKKLCTHYDGPAGVLPVHALVAQVQHKCGRAVKESKHTHTHEELGRRRVVALQVGGVGPRAVTQRHFVV